MPRVQNCLTVVAVQALKKRQSMTRVAGPTKQRALGVTQSGTVVLSPPNNMDPEGEPLRILRVH